jgi:hypothetical protein
MFCTPWWPNSGRRAPSAPLSKMSPDRGFCLAYKRGGEVWRRSCIGFAACPVQANTRSGPGRTTSRVAGACFAHSALLERSL